MGLLPGNGNVSITPKASTNVNMYKVQVKVIGFKVWETIPTNRYWVLKAGMLFDRVNGDFARQWVDDEDYLGDGNNELNMYPNRDTPNYWVTIAEYVDGDENQYNDFTAVNVNLGTSWVKDPSLAGTQFALSCWVYQNGWIFTYAYSTSETIYSGTEGIGNILVYHYYWSNLGGGLDIKVQIFGA